MDMMKTLAELVSAFGPSGCENEVSQVIEKLAKPYVDEISRDALGSLICRKKGSGPRVMFCAHMDSVGMVATHIDEKGYIHVGPLGGVGAAKVLHTPVRFRNGTRGLFCTEMGADLSKLQATDLVIDIGAADGEEAKKLVQVGDAAVYDTPTRTVGNRVISPYMDNRISCLALLMVMEQLGETDNDLYFVFSSQEEVGTRGAKTAAWAVDPDYAIVMDVRGGAEEIPGSKHQPSCRCGKGPCVCLMDNTTIFHPEMVKKLEALAQEIGIPTQRAVSRMGGTDAGPIHQSRAGVYTGGISIPCRYVHTPTELVDLGDVQACADLTAAFAVSKLER